MFLQRCDQVVDGPVDDDIGAQAADEIGFFLRADRRHHLAAQGLHQLDRRHAETTRSGLDQNSLPRLQAALDAQVQIRRGERFGDGGGFNHGQAFRHGQDQLHRYRNAFGIPAAAEQCADLVTGFPAAVRRGLGDDARHFQPHPLRPAWRRRVVPRTLQQVRTIQRGGMNVNQKLAGFAEPDRALPSKQASVFHRPRLRAFQVLIPRVSRRPSASTPERATRARGDRDSRFRRG